VDRHKADPLAGQGEILGIRRGDEAVRVVLEDAGHFLIVIDDLSIRLVGHQVNRSAILTAFLLEDPAELLEGAGGVYLPRGVVGRIDQNNLRPLADGLFDSGQVQGEIIVGGNGLEHSSVVVGIKAIFHKIGGGDQQFIAGIEERLQDDI